MAVTFHSSPPQASQLISASYPLIIIAQTDKYDTANITQHRFRLEVRKGGLVIANLYTVVDDESNKRGTFDFGPIIKPEFIRDKEDGSGNDVPAITDFAFVGDDYVNCLTYLYEQYYDTGVFTENAAGSRQFYIQRGYTDDANYDMKFYNWYELTGRENVLQLSGRHPIAYPIKVDDPSWIPQFVNNYTWVVLKKNGGAVVYQKYWARDPSQELRYDYLQLFIPGVSDAADFQYYTLEVYTNNSTVVYTGGTFEYTFDIYKTVEVCDDEEEILIMFLDRLYQWSFLSFPKKNRVTVATESQRAELPYPADEPGRFRYNVEGSDVLALNTAWMDETNNDLIRDCVQSERHYLVDSGDGSLEQVVLQQNSVQLRTSRNNNLISYAMSFRKSVNNFIP